jgi:adenosylcobinamide kinase/adenosylcobinamide-phosphate guanylyltransferase
MAVAKIVLIVGGCRSGKSAYAQRLAESLPPERLYVATCPVIDEEMARRIEAHRAARAGRGWETIEEPLDLAAALARGHGYGAVLVDCVTLWINNLMYAAGQDAGSLAEGDVATACHDVLAAAAPCRGTVLFVSNEVGLGIVPDNPEARRYRDLVGRANQEIAARADTVTMVSCGIPWPLKEVCR